MKLEHNSRAFALIDRLELEISLDLDKSRELEEELNDLQRRIVDNKALLKLVQE